VFYTKVR